MSRRQAAEMERRAVPGELSGRRGVATLARGVPVHFLPAFAHATRSNP